MVVALKAFRDRFVYALGSALFFHAYPLPGLDDLPFEFLLGAAVVSQTVVDLPALFKRKPKRRPRQ